MGGKSSKEKKEETPDSPKLQRPVEDNGIVDSPKRPVEDNGIVQTQTPSVSAESSTSSANGTRIASSEPGTSSVNRPTRAASAKPSTSSATRTRIASAEPIISSANRTRITSTEPGTSSVNRPTRTASAKPITSSATRARIASAEPIISSANRTRIASTEPGTSSVNRPTRTASARPSTSLANRRWIASAERSTSSVETSEFGISELFSELPRIRQGSDRETGPDPETVVLKSPKDLVLLVVSIDFGTTYSGYGYSFKDNPDKIYTNYWDGIQLKTPTQVLFKPDKTFHSFGFEAGRQFEELTKRKEHHNWYLFSRFKMKLFVKDEPLTIDMKIQDIGDKDMAAIDVFSAAIGYMVTHCLAELNRKEDSFKISDVHWILTVPAIWDDLSKSFMRKAATQAGIREDLLSIALEPEAASLFCIKDLTDINMKPGTKYMVMDLGGGTADIICHEVNSDGTSLKELHRATGGDFGGTSVDDRIMNNLLRIISAKVIKTFKMDHMEEYWELLKEFENKKKYFDGSREIVIQFPLTLLHMHKANVGEDITDTLQSSPLKGKLKFERGKLMIERTFAIEIFDDIVNKIRNAAQEVLDRIDGIEYIILVGGFSGSPYLQKVMKVNFDNLIRIPKEPSTAVLKGAVIYGQSTKVISSRVCKFTYGIARMMKFKPDRHPERKRIQIGNMEYCDDLFDKHIEIGQAVSIDALAKKHDYFPPVNYKHPVVLEVYASSKRNPQFIDEEDCHFVGLIKIDVDPKGNIWAKLKVGLIFGGTELIVEVLDVINNKITRGTVEFLG